MGQLFFQLFHFHFISSYIYLYPFVKAQREQGVDALLQKCIEKLMLLCSYVIMPFRLEIAILKIGVNSSTLESLRDPNSFLESLSRKEKKVQEYFFSFQ